MDKERGGKSIEREVRIEIGRSMTFTMDKESDELLKRERETKVEY